MTHFIGSKAGEKQAAPAPTHAATAKALLECFVTVAYTVLSVVAVAVLPPSPTVFILQLIRFTRQEVMLCSMPVAHVSERAVSRYFEASLCLSVGETDLHVFGGENGGAEINNKRARGGTMSNHVIGYATYYVLYCAETTVIYSFPLQRSVCS